jgi:glycosyltransferase involved in cell wall biosynthesis
MTELSRLGVAVFSFNRGPHLAHCVASVLRCIPGAAVTVYDDGSDDPVTLRILDGIGVPVRRPGLNAQGRNGGLYGNMQAALAEARTEWLLFLQDDMQAVRCCDPDDASAIADAFAADPSRGFVCPLFMKSGSLARYRRLLRPSLAPRLYSAREGVRQAERIAYYDVSIGHVARLHQAGWRFRGSEADNVAQARALFSDMPFMGDPFVFFCPEVPVFRNRGSGISGRLAARVVGREVKGFRDMSREEAETFRSRPLDRWPVAEDWLTPTDPTVRRPFVYKDVGARWWLRLLHKAESTLRR